MWEIYKETKRFIYIKREVGRGAFYNRITKKWFVPIVSIIEKLQGLIEFYYKRKGSINYAYCNRMWIRLREIKN